MTAAALAIRLVDHALAEFAVRAETMSAERLQAELGDITMSGRSAAGDLVAAVLDRELRRREREDDYR
ncbi:MAG: hypothetical protein E5Y79_16075 [Mesorhizobium sp.]|uniref:hypothetical protein n=1 Tax=Mesorhizobium sp. TaxID=1871066 RepID=UPI001211FFD1|nr:hypothetical protein [Mesorhizobium sp.]TIL59252.1 MAG: hypothetical protein E5Y79_16075 [Mesorhizobium sp.]